MDEEIKQILGDNYKEGMTADEIKDAFKGLILSSGDYVKKGKADAEKSELEKSLQAQIDNYKNQLSAKMTDEEKELQAQKARDEEIKELKELLRKTNLNSNQMRVTANLAETKKMLSEISDNAKYESFIKNITFEDEGKSDETSNYIASLIKNAYEKGKADATKDSLGNMGKNKTKTNDADDKNDDVSEFGARLAKERIVQVKPNNFFKGGKV